MTPLNMPDSVYQAYKKDFQNGVVTLGNLCSAKCTFCSQYWNPAGVIQNLERLLTWQEVKHFVDEYLVKVGENPHVSPSMGSALHTNSGEFFLHPAAGKILEYLKTNNKLADNQVVISNGMNFKKEHIQLLKDLKIGIQLSLFATDVSARMDVMKGSFLQNKRAIDTLNLFEAQGIEYGITIVPYKKYLRNGVMENIFRDLKGYQAKEFVMHKPGYTKLTPMDVVEELNIPDQELLDFGHMIWEKYQTKVRIEGVTPVEKNLSEFMRISQALTPLKTLGNKFKLFLCSSKAQNLIKLVLKKIEMQDYELKVVDSHVFGGSVDCAGLLTVEDYILSIKEFVASNKKPDFLVMSKRSFDINKEDLKMVSVYQLQDIFNAKVILV